MRVRLNGIVSLLAVMLPALAWAASPQSKLDAPLRTRAEQPQGSSRVIVRMLPGISADAAIKAVSGTMGRWLPAVNGRVAVVADAALHSLAARSDVLSVSLDRRVQGTLERTAATIGVPWPAGDRAVDGAGVGVAIVDSGVANWHDDLGNDRVVHFADFVSFLPQPHDDYGHGTHVAGIIAGNGYDSGGARRGIAPGARLIVLKVLDAAGDGYISNVIAAIDYAIEQRDRFNIRVLNLSVAAGVYESFTSDPFTLAAKRAADAGIVVVTAAGNLGQSENGQVQRGGITAPGNAPWVLTVGATNHQRTTSRSDDTLAPFSSRGPTNIDRAMKPDVSAPGVGIESLAAAGSTICNVNATARLSGTVDTADYPYLSMTGTSMAAPVVAATAALMLQVNPALTPNLVKAVIQYTAERRPRVDLAAQGAGFLNARGAIQLAGALRDASTGTLKSDSFAPWSRHVIWGSQRVRGGVLTADANAWRNDVIWGAAVTPDGDPIVWGTRTNGDAWGSGEENEALTFEAADAAFFSAFERRRDEERTAGFMHLGPRQFVAIAEERRRTRREPDEAGSEGV